MTFQPHEHEGPRVVQVPDVPILADWGHADCAICAKDATEPARGMTPQEDLQGEALRRAWLEGSYGLRPELQEPAVSGRALVIAIALAAVCWAIIGAGVWFVWRLF